MTEKLTKNQELKFKKSLVEANIIECIHEPGFTFNGFCLICKKEIISEKKGDMPL